MVVEHANRVDVCLVDEGFVRCLHGCDGVIRIPRCASTGEDPNPGLGMEKLSKPLPVLRSVCVRGTQKRP